MVVVPSPSLSITVVVSVSVAFSQGASLFFNPLLHRRGSNAFVREHQEPRREVVFVYTPPVFTPSFILPSEIILCLFARKFFRLSYHFFAVARMANDNRRSNRVKTDESIKPKKKMVKQDASSASILRSSDASSSRRSSRETSSRKQTKENPTSTRKSKRLEKQNPSATPPIKEKSERTQKQTITTPLKRYDRRKKHTSLGSLESKKIVEEPASSNIKSKKDKVGRSLKRCVMDASEDHTQENHGLDVGGRKRKRVATSVNKALSKLKRIKTEAGDDNDKESQDKASEANSSSNSGTEKDYEKILLLDASAFPAVVALTKWIIMCVDVDMKLKRPDKLLRLDNCKNECSGSKSVEDEDDGGEECSDRSEEDPTLITFKRGCMTTDSGLSNFDVEEVNDDAEVKEADLSWNISSAKGHKASLNSRGVEGIPHHAVQESLDEGSMDLGQVGNVGCPSRKSLDGKSVESGTEALISGTSTSSNIETSARKTDPDTCRNTKNHPISPRSPSSRCKRHGHKETCLACSKKQRLETFTQVSEEGATVQVMLKEMKAHGSGKQQKLNSCDTKCNADLCDTSSSEDRTTCEAAGLAESFEKDNGVSRMGTSICNVCKLGGKLRCYHLSCLDPPVNSVPSGNWCCPFCVKNIKSCVQVIESIWDTREVEVSDAEGLQKQYFVKYKGLAHIHNQWITETQLLLEAPLLMENFSKNSLMRWTEEWTVPHQLLKKRLILSFKPLYGTRQNSGKVLNYHNEWLVKWQGLDSEQATWELENITVLDSPEGYNLVREHENQHGNAKIPSSSDDKIKELSVKLPTIPAGNPAGVDDIHLSYVKKLHDAWNKEKNNLVFDDQLDLRISEFSEVLLKRHERNMMGMSHLQERTLRIVLFILSLKGVTLPFLLITPSNSLSQWEAMFSRIALCNDLKVSLEEGQRGSRLLEVQKEGGQLAFQVLLYHVDAFVKDLNVLKAIKWEAVIVDESQSLEISSHFSHVKSLSTYKRLLVFSGPLVVSMAGYLDVLSLLDFDGAWPNLSKFIAYECKSSSSKFVEFWVPVQISNLQLEQYCSMLLSNAMALSSCSKSDTFGALHDILASNRKVCSCTILASVESCYIYAVDAKCPHFPYRCLEAHQYCSYQLTFSPCCDHPYIVDQGLQGVLTKGLEPAKFLDVGIKASGKLQFLDLILPEMRKRQLRVLILFQPLSGSGKDSTSIGDILDDFVRQRFGEDSYERVDGIGTIPSKKQAALNNFNNKDMGRFIFLLEYRACLPSIKLSSVDIIVIFDSDWNPANDLRALQKIALDPQSEQIMIFRLYTSWTLEEKILILAEHNVTIDSKLQNLSRSTSDALLTWGATYLFKKLTEFHSTSVLNISSEEHLLNEVTEEFLNLISHKCKNTDTSKSIITRVQQSGGTYSKNLPLPSELITQLPNGEQPNTFWRNLLVGRVPCWKFLSRSTPRQRKRPQYCEQSPKKINAGNEDVGRKRKKTANITEPVASISGTVEGEIAGACRGISSVPSHDGSQSSPGNSFWCDAVHNETDFQSLLKLNISKLCEVLGLSGDVKIMVERFLEYVIENYHVNEEPANTLQAFLISLCWIGSALLKHKLDRRQSVALAKKHLSFICNEEEAKSVYLKLEPARDMFLRHTENQKKSDVSKDRIPSAQATFTWSLDPRVSHPGPFDLQDVKVENQMEFSGSEHGDQDSPKRAPVLSRNLMEVECPDKIVHGEHHGLVISSDIMTSPNATVSGSICSETILSHTDPNSASVTVNALSFKLASASIEDQPNGRSCAKTGTNNVEVDGNVFEEVSGARNKEQSKRPCSSSNSENSTEPTSSRASVKQVVDVATSSVPVEEIPVKNHEGVCNDVEKQVDSLRMKVLLADCNKEITEAGATISDRSHFREDQNDISPNDVEGHLGSVGMVSLAVGCNQKDDSNSPSAAVSKEKLPSVLPLVFPASGQSVPTYLEIRNESVQDNVVQGYPCSSTEINNLRTIDAGKDGQFNSEDSSLHLHEESCFSLSANPAVAENQSDTPSVSKLVPEITSDGQTTLSAATPPGHEAHNPPPSPEAPPQVSEITTEVSSRAATPPGPNLLNMQGSENHNQGVSWAPNKSKFSSDPLQAEVEKLHELKDNVIKFHEAIVSV
ncbi:Chromo domain-containing protein [Cynara cardunculus var. scolymus]|uniref:Chromo domain-containing protein n=1 Tax=Cynara cardunculus var. scolymus TaxID=59895 RepID=A0A103YHR1_CYNCS|nr:Chromo domain-containing protein [Cynara cardunculus var. scolymus]